MQIKVKKVTLIVQISFVEKIKAEDSATFQNSFSSMADFRDVFVIFNTSLSTGEVPILWKCSNIIPIPKVKQPLCESDTRPISLTPILSKVLEDFVVSWMIEDVGEHIDSRQFGSLTGSSTTYCLLDLIHNWLSELDNPGCYLRASFLDFSKAFDRIHHTIVIRKLIDLGLRRSIKPWICSFLTDR